jgi:hypothetical protein
LGITSDHDAAWRFVDQLSTVCLFNMQEEASGSRVVDDTTEHLPSALMLQLNRTSLSEGESGRVGETMVEKSSRPKRRRPGTMVYHHRSATVDIERRVSRGKRPMQSDHVKLFDCGHCSSCPAPVSALLPDRAAH